MSSTQSVASKSRLLISFLIALALLVPGLMVAQSFRGSIRGKVTDPSGSLIAGAKVTVKSPATGLGRETLTAEDGSYVLAELPAGEYVVTAESAGGRDYRVRRLFHSDADPADQHRYSLSF